jgi:hypothetical protein
VTSSTASSYGFSNRVVSDSSRTTISFWFESIPLPLGAPVGFFGFTWFPVSSLCHPCPSFVLSMSIPIGVVYWVSSTMSVGILGVISGDGVLSTLTTFGCGDGCFSSPFDCICALVLTLGFLEVWLSYSCLGDAMVVGTYHSLSSVDSATSLIFSTFPLCCVFSIIICLLYFRNNIFSPASSLCMGFM